MRQLEEGLDKTYHLNTFDINFFKRIIGHPMVSTETAINIYNYFL